MNAGNLISRELMENVYAITNNKSLLNIKSLNLKNIPENEFALNNLTVGSLVEYTKEGKWEKYTITSEMKRVLSEDRDIIEFVNDTIEKETEGKCVYGLSVWANNFNEFIGSFTNREFVV